MRRMPLTDSSSLPPCSALLCLSPCHVDPCSNCPTAPPSLIHRCRVTRASPHCAPRTLRPSPTDRLARASPRSATNLRECDFTHLTVPCTSHPIPSLSVLVGPSVRPSAAPQPSPTVHVRQAASRCRRRRCMLTLLCSNPIARACISLARRACSTRRCRQAE